MSGMTIFVTAVHVLLCVFMIFVILLQPGKDAGMGAAFGGGAATSAFGGRGAVTFLSKLTAACAALFFITSLGLSMVGMSGSVTSRITAPPAAPTPAAPKAVEQAPAAPAPGAQTAPATPAQTPGATAPTRGPEPVEVPPEGAAQNLGQTGTPPVNPSNSASPRPPAGAPAPTPAQ